MDCTKCRCEMRQQRYEELEDGGRVRIWVCANPRCSGYLEQKTERQKQEETPAR